MPRRLVLALSVVFVTALFAAEPEQGRVVPGPGAVLKPRQAAEAVNRLLADRLENLLPRLMRETGIDCWVVICREYAEDPVYLTLVPEPVFAARRSTMLVFFDRGPEKGLERLTVSRYGLGEHYKGSWEGGDDDSQWRRLAAILAERDPRKIAIDVSRDWAFGDGLTAGLRDRFVAALTPELRGRVASAEALCIRWLETRTERELEVYPHVVALARGVIAEAFSERVITPGATTARDVAWWIRHRFEELGLSPWFQPSVDVQRKDPTLDRNAPWFGKEDVVIVPGDVLHCDVGVRYLRLATDTQEMGYVLRPGETDAPESLVKALATGNRWQDLLAKEFVTGRTGNEILAATLAAAKNDGVTCKVYTHPIGHHGHGAGPTIGMWDNQGPTPTRGDWKLHPSTAYAIEGMVVVPLEEWGGQPVQIKLEQTAVFDGERVRYLAGRQTRWHLVR